MAGTRRWYFMRAGFFRTHHIELDGSDAMQRLERIGSSRFYLEKTTRTLFKVVEDKYDRRHHPGKWFARDILEKRLLYANDATKEWRSNRILRRAGLATLDCRGVGIALNAFNPLGSVYAMPYLVDAVSGETYFKGLPEPERRAFVRRLCDEVLRLARLGYCHRDLHYGNFMVDTQGQFIWIDTHVRRLPRRRDRRRKILERMLSPTKLQGQAYRDLALRHIVNHVDEKARGRLP